MPAKLTPEYIESLINFEEFLIQPEIILCKLTVGESVFVGQAHCFDTAVQNIARGRESARRNAINKIFDAEAYHLKRERDKLNRQYGIHHLPVYDIVRKAGGCIRLISVSAVENLQHHDLYQFDIVSDQGDLKSESFIIDRKDSKGTDVQLQGHLNALICGLEVECVEQSDGSEKVINMHPRSTSMGRHYAEQSDAEAKVVHLNLFQPAADVEGHDMVSPSVHEGGGAFSGAGAGGSWGETEKVVSSTVREGTTSDNHNHSHNHSQNSTPSESNSGTDSNGGGSSD